MADAAAATPRRLDFAHDDLSLQLPGAGAGATALVDTPEDVLAGLGEPSLENFRR